ncbi:hypothetical protein KUL72_19970 [Bradyrhizobium arachidis]|uniref:hypothetical protein n=1 Tax=Bradyrhizobium arachidis TaxID=858423 RepID=UPI0021621D72|nr:hypothetical protein [Bradyrhizobium arachidis]UVO33800.1 hypothetical protein KUL72_19970 [Bradyrhizobium arachidis]
MFGVILRALTMENVKTAIDIFTALFAIIAAWLWIKSAQVEVWADGQTEAKPTSNVINKNGRLFDVTATMQSQSDWSARAAYAAAVAASLQAAGVIVGIIIARNCS